MEKKNAFCKFLNYNIEGLLQKLKNQDFVNFVNGFDFVCLTETFLNFDLRCNVFEEFELFNAPARKLSHKSRCSGGTLVMIRKLYMKYFDRIDVHFHNTVVMKMSKDLMETGKDIIVICGYLPPVASPAYDEADAVIGIEILE